MRALYGLFWAGASSLSLALADRAVSAFVVPVAAAIDRWQPDLERGSARSRVDALRALLAAARAGTGDDVATEKAASLARELLSDIAHASGL